MTERIPHANRIRGLSELLAEMEAAGTAESLLASHVESENPHTQYLLDGSTTADIADSEDRRYVTDALLEILEDTSGANTGDQDLSGLSVVGHGHTISDVDELQNALDAKADLVDGYIPTSQIPAVAISEFLGAVADEEAMLLLEGQPSDFCFREDVQSVFILVDNDATDADSWLRTAFFVSDVQSVNGQTGVIVLGPSDIGAASDSHAATHSADGDDPLTLGKSQVGLGNVDNTSDAGKPISTATQTALDGKASKSGDTFTGSVVVPAGSASVPGLRVGNTGTGLSSPATDVLAFATAGSERARVTATGDLIVNGSGVNGGIFSRGGFLQIGSVSDATGKDAKFAASHYLTAEEPIIGLRILSLATTNVVQFGGGSSTGNAATSIGFYCASNNTTTSGTQVAEYTAGGITLRQPVAVGSITPTDMFDVNGHARVRGVVRHQSYTVGTLPTTGISAMSSSYASNGRKSGEGSGSGTGVPVWYDGTNWKTYYDNTTVAA